MAVFRVERNKGYTVMSNHHLRNKELTLKAKGLLSQMLSLPEDWDYTLAGLSQINREKIDAIREAIKELERAGYIVRSRERDEKGRLRGADYVIYEQPHTEPTPDLPTLENPTLDNPMQEKPMLEKPTLENPMQLNKDIQRTDLPTKEKRNTDLQSTYSIPIHSPNPSPLEQEAAAPPERKRKEAEAQTAFEIYREIIKENIDYDILIKPYTDPVFENNIPLTQTERLTMNSRPKQPKYARNKNILVIGGSGSGKTRFFVKPSLMQMHSSYVVTDPKGLIS